MEVGNQVRFVTVVRKRRKRNLTRMVGIIKRIEGSFVSIECKGKVFHREIHQVAQTGAM